MKENEIKRMKENERENEIKRMKERMRSSTG